MQFIGPCTFEQLPQKYQTLYESGANLVENGRFIPEKNYSAIIIHLGFLYLFASIPAIFIAEFNLEPVSLVGFLLFLPLIILTAVAIIKIRQLVDVIKKLNQGTFNFGLIIDDENIVLRKFDTFSFKNCLFIPLAHLNSAYPKRSTGRRATRAPSAFRLSYNNHHGKQQWISLAGENDLDFNLFKLDDLFKEVQKSDVRGEWSRSKPIYEEPPYDTIIHFNEPDGLIEEWHNQEKTSETPFLFQQINQRTIEIITADNSQRPYSPKLKSGIYTFSIEVKLERTIDTGKTKRYYKLRFDQEFLGLTHGSYGQAL